MYYPNIRQKNLGKPRQNLPEEPILRRRYKHYASQTQAIRVISSDNLIIGG
jgi:hypothetical protein